MFMCPHCQTSEHGSGAFCVRCGKALPQQAGPRIVRDNDMASSHTGQQLQSDQLAKRARTASTTLLILGGLQLTGAAIFIALGLAAKGVPASAGASPEAALVLGVILAVLGSIFGALGMWARKAPLPAAVTGLTLYLTLMGLGALLDPASIVSGLIIKIVIIAALVKAIQAGMKHRELQREMNPGVSTDSFRRAA